MPAMDQYSTRKYGFLLLPDFTMISVSACVETLRMANRISGDNLYEYELFSLDGSSVAASNGLTLHPISELSQDVNPEAIFVCAGLSLNREWEQKLSKQLRPLARKKVILGGICTGSYLLARIGQLEGYRSTVHWENIREMREEFPDLIISAELFEIDRDRYTCSGGTAPMDMMLTLISRQHGIELATAISEQFIYDRIRGPNDRQRIPLKQRFGNSQPKLIEAVELMESNIEEPMGLDELAQHVGVSRRQLERIFKKHLDCVPTRYYLELRLRRARELLLTTPRSIVDVAFACGFVSPPHFSKCYREFFKIPPRDERNNIGTTKTDF
ncbi:MAG: AraC family transcriptional regulator [Acidiferrobacteraceae bacterium]|nr:AraC family transcriptional regulator [Acidiferrobacteraceae bacterium]|tara:strand:+ start:10180 stop:11163 length:984 start_codon:yes stop_codon:yes gene_type:complete